MQLLLISFFLLTSFIHCHNKVFFTDLAYSPFQPRCIWELAWKRKNKKIRHRKRIFDGACLNCCCSVVDVVASVAVVAATDVVETPWRFCHHQRFTENIFQAKNLGDCGSCDISRLFKNSFCNNYLKKKFIISEKQIISFATCV